MQILDRFLVLKRGSSLDSRRWSEKQPGTGLIFQQARPPGTRKDTNVPELPQGCEFEVGLWLPGGRRVSRLERAGGAPFP